MPNKPAHDDTPHDVELEEYLRECVKIEPLAIQEEFVRIPADLAYWNARYALALREHLTAKIDLDVTRAKLQPIVRLAIQEAGGKVTESQVDAAIESHDSYVDARRRVADAEVAKNELFGSLDAIRAKKDMLMSLGAHLRVEMEGDPVMREHVRGRSLVKG